MAVILIDARQGVLKQTRRHSYICSLLGIRHIVVAINKMDLVDYSRDVLKRSKRNIALSRQTRLSSIVCIPMSALEGDNINDKERTHALAQRPGASSYLESIEVASDRTSEPFRLPVQ
ncbi:MAG: GTP-binding protein [Parvularculaceae bacterium]